MMRTRTALVLGLLLTLATGGCGAASNGTEVARAPGSSTPGPTSVAAMQQEGQQQALKYSQCMRANGVPDFPDPTFQGGGSVSLDVPAGTDHAAMDKAAAACKKYQPSGGAAAKMSPADLEKLRKVSQCMRANGVPNFPDPTTSGIQVNGNTSGLDPSDPTFQAADKLCSQYAPKRAGGASDERRQVNSKSGG